MRDVEAPRQKIGKCGAGHGRRCGGTVRPEHGNADRAGVEAFRVRSDHGLVDAAVATLEHLPVLVDEKVVADVVPAVALHVVDLDAAHDRGGLRSGVRVVPAVWWTSANCTLGGVARRRTANRLVRTPGLAVDQRRRAGHRDSAQRNADLRTANEVGAQPLDAAAQAVLDSIGRAGPVRVAETPAAPLASRHSRRPEGPRPPGRRAARRSTGLRVSAFGTAPCPVPRQCRPTMSNCGVAARQGASTVQRHLAHGQRDAAQCCGGRREECEHYEQERPHGGGNLVPGCLYPASASRAHALP